MLAAVNPSFDAVLLEVDEKREKRGKLPVR